MKIFKRFDLFFQVAILVTGLILCILTPVYPIPFYLYFAVGGWQLLSCLIHWLFSKDLLQNPDRAAYLKTIFWTFAIGVFCMLPALIGFPLILYYLFALLFVSPFFAIWYFVICYVELSRINKKEFIHLK